MKKLRVFLLAFAALLLTLLLALGIYAASSPTVLPVTNSAKGYWQVREDGGKTYDLSLVVNANKNWLDGYREAWLDLVFATPDGGHKTYHGKVKELFLSVRTPDETFKADESCVLFGVVVTNIPYKPLSASATLTLTGNGIKDETIALGSIEKLPQKVVPSYMTVDKITLHSLITGGKDLNDSNTDVATVTFGNWETYQSKLAGTSLAAWESGLQAGVEPDTVRLFRVPNGENEYGTTYDVYILSKTGRVALPEDCTWLFYGLAAMTALHADDLDTSAVTNMFGLFQGCVSLTEIAGLTDWNVSSVTDMSMMFFGCSALTAADLPGWNTANVTDMSHMFAACYSFTDFTPLTRWDVSSVTDMNYMFCGCTALTDLKPLADWDVSSVTDMSRMFYGCSALTDLTGLENWDVSSVTDMSRMFRDCEALTVTDLSGWNTANVTNMSEMFRDCSHLETVYVSNNFVVPSRADSMFSGCNSLSGKYWNGSEYVVKTMYDSFGTADTYNRICSATEDGYLTLKVK